MGPRHSEAFGLALVDKMPKCKNPSPMIHAPTDHMGGLRFSLLQVPLPCEGSISEVLLSRAHYVATEMAGVQQGTGK